MSVASDMNYYYSRLSSKRIQLEQQKMVNTQIESLLCFELFAFDNGFYLIIIRL